MQGFTPPVIHVSSGAIKKKVKKSPSCLRAMVELIFFFLWLLCTGIIGYFVGYDPTSIECPELIKPKVHRQIKKCENEKINPISINTPLVKDDGFTIDELKSLWKCSHAEANITEVHKQIYPEKMDLKKTKWKSILTVEPKAFFDKYLSQYPGDTRSVQPVIVFSHKPLNSFEEMGDVCKVVDVTVVPDKPDVCVAVTETYHDVASYHMLHASRQDDGSFALTSNTIEGRALPSEVAYAAARCLLLSFFELNEYVQNALKDVPKYNKGRVVIGCLVEDSDDVELFMNSVASGARAGISKNKYAIFTTSSQVKKDLARTKIKIIYLPKLAKVGTQGDGNVGPKLRRWFLQAWLAFGSANNLIKVLWQSPATVWFKRPDDVVNDFPAVESLWAYKGRKDKRSAPFFITMDFFVSVGVERPIHLLHELLLHFDLIIAWDSIDAVAAYRLSENNSRYGTTTHVMAPYKVLHTDLMNHDPMKIRAAVLSKDRPFVVISPKNFENPNQVKRMLADSGLWFL